jgi:hypothetical protein
LARRQSAKCKFLTRVDPQDKMITPERIEKHMLRKAFDTSDEPETAAYHVLLDTLGGDHLVLGVNTHAGLEELLVEERNTSLKFSGARRSSSAMALATAGLMA